MQQAFILINTDPGKINQIADSARKVDGVKMAYAVTGPFDVIIYAEVADMSALGAVINIVHSIDGVQKTQTAIAIPPRIESVG
jgi:DNA-binding Lrp family transcriptional regulator